MDNQRFAYALREEEWKRRLIDIVNFGATVPFALELKRFLAKKDQFFSEFVFNVPVKFTDACPLCGAVFDIYIHVQSGYPCNSTCACGAQIDCLSIQKSRRLSLFSTKVYRGFVGGPHAIDHKKYDVYPLPLSWHAKITELRSFVNSIQRPWEPKPWDRYIQISTIELPPMKMDRWTKHHESLVTDNLAEIEPVAP